MIAKKWWQGGVGIVGRRRGGTKRPDRQEMEKEEEEERKVENHDNNNDDDKKDEAVVVSEDMDTKTTSQSSFSVFLPHVSRKTLSKRMTPELIHDQITTTTITRRNPSWQAAILAGTCEPKWWKVTYKENVDQATSTTIEGIISTSCSVVSFHNWGNVLWEQGRAAWRYRDPTSEPPVLVLSSSSDTGGGGRGGRRKRQQQRRRGKSMISHENQNEMEGKEEEEGSKALITTTTPSENRKPLRDVINFYSELWGCNTITGDDDW